MHTHLQTTNPVELTREILSYQDLLMASALEPPETLTAKVYDQQQRKVAIKSTVLVL